MSVQFRVNPAKALEVILYIANRKPRIGKHALLKVLFYADKAHLNAFGRPIVGDYYIAMEFGPVGSITYDLLKGTDAALEAVELDRLPFRVEDRFHIVAERSADERKLSASDRKTLDDAIARYAHLSFGKLTQLTHAEPAYERAEPMGRMSYEDFVDEGGDRDAKIDELREVAHRLVI